MAQIRIRHFWLSKIEQAFQKRAVVWLAGVRRVGKTYLAQSMVDAEYFDCELPRVRRMLDDPEEFLRAMPKRTIVLDEIHRLSDPSQLLKIAADHFEGIRILATGSSVLGASGKFKDTLTGRKTQLWLTPMNLSDGKDFGNSSLKHRLLHGGLPPFFISSVIPEPDFQDWMDAYWAKDIQELFRLERKSSFQKFVELLMMRSGGIFEASSYTSVCEVSRPTIANYLAVVEATYVAQIIKPFSSHRPTEIISAPKVYGFDTGFVAYYRGWSDLHTSELGMLWEHLVLNELNSHFQSRALNYWRDKRGHELDFVFAPRGQSPIAIECKWKAAEFEAASLKSFRGIYPSGKNIVVASDVDTPFNKSFAGHSVRFVGLSQVCDEIVH